MKKKEIARLARIYIHPTARIAAYSYLLTFFILLLGLSEVMKKNFQCIKKQ